MKKTASRSRAFIESREKVCEDNGGDDVCECAGGMDYGYVGWALTIWSYADMMSTFGATWRHLLDASKHDKNIVINTLSHKTYD